MSWVDDVLRKINEPRQITEREFCDACKNAVVQLCHDRMQGGLDPWESHVVVRHYIKSMIESGEVMDLAGELMEMYLDDWLDDISDEVEVD